MNKKNPLKLSVVPLRAIAGGFYDIQKMRIAMGNRIAANFKIRLGQETGMSEADLDKEAKDLLVKVRIAYKSMADAAAKLPRISKFEGNEVISDYAEFVLAEGYAFFMDQEERALKQIKQIIHTNPFWNHWMEGVKGLGELMALVILSYVDIAEAKYPSSIWKFAGLDVAEDGHGRSKRKEHLIKKIYTNKYGVETERDSITFHPLLKSKLIGVLGPSFIKSGNEKYVKVYTDYKHRLENHPKYKDGSERPPWVSATAKYSPKLRRHNMAIRKMVKIFLIDLYVAWRSFEGLPVSEPYAKAKLGIVHHENRVFDQNLVTQ
jgi:hypothetical protein